MRLSSKHLLGIKDLSKEDIQLILSTANQFKEVLQEAGKKSAFTKGYNYRKPVF
jgi:aspartate carbamoyltransferase catalytic subunit